MTQCITTTIPILATHLYNEGGRHVRPVVILPCPPQSWPTRNIAFYRTSGQSNEGFDIYRGTWFPIFGYSQDPKKMETHKLLKMGDYDDILKKPTKSGFPALNVSSSPIYNLATEFILWRLRNNITDEMRERYEEKAIKVKNGAWTNFITYQHIIKFLTIYFLDAWQVIISRNIGGGIWDRSPEEWRRINQETTAEFRKNDEYMNNLIEEFELFKTFLEEFCRRHPITLPHEISDGAIGRFIESIGPGEEEKPENGFILQKFLKKNDAQLDTEDLKTMPHIVDMRPLGMITIPGQLNPATNPIKLSPWLPKIVSKLYETEKLKQDERLKQEIKINENMELKVEKRHEQANKKRGIQAPTSNKPTRKPSTRAGIQQQTRTSTRLKKKGGSRNKKTRKTKKIKRKSRK